MPKPFMSIHGRGSHGKVILDAIHARRPNEPVRITDDADGTSPSSNDFFICGIGDNRIRKRVGGTLTVIHPAARLSFAAEIGDGVFVGANVWIGPHAKIGAGAIINNGAIIEHEVTVGPYAHIASGAVLSGKVSIGEGALIGANATIRLGQKVGDWAVVGCGAVVVDDVPAAQIWAGNPAKPLLSASLREDLEPACGK